MSIVFQKCLGFGADVSCKTFEPWQLVVFDHTDIAELPIAERLDRNTLIRHCNVEETLHIPNK